MIFFSFIFVLFFLYTTRGVWMFVELFGNANCVDEVCSGVQ